LRLGQFIIWPSLGYQLRTQRRKDQEPVSNLAPRYIALYNGVWLVANDVILGQAAGKWICDNHKGIARLLSRSLSPILVDGLVSTLDWLNDWPAGLKLNTQLSHFFRDMFVGLTAAWNDTCLSPLLHDGAALSQLVYLVGLFSRLMGLTMLLSVIVDILQLLTLHWTVFYQIQQAIFSFFCTSIISLFHLFRGKKRNPLRKNRIDQATYELDQLLLGTIFFTLLVFLWLTVAIYYLQFSLLRLALVGVIVVLQTGLAFLNHLPLFALMLRIKEPDRLPGGVELRHFQVESSSSNPLHCCYYELHNTPLSIQDIFRGYNGHLQAIRELPGLLWSLVIGRKF
jgi:phosphatidylinositol glycan class Q protein